MRRSYGRRRSGNRRFFRRYRHARVGFGGARL